MTCSLYLVIETPRAGAFDLLQSATSDDDAPPAFYFHASKFNNPEKSATWKFDSEIVRMHFEDAKPQETHEKIIFLSNNLGIADQIEGCLETIRQNDSLVMARVLTFIDSEILHHTPPDFQDWIDAVAHFTDSMLFVHRSNNNASAIQQLIDRYTNMRYPMETFILGKKNNPWTRILDPTPRRLSHVFDPIELLEDEDLPEHDRYLSRLASGEYKQKVPLPFLNDHISF